MGNTTFACKAFRSHDEAGELAVAGVKWNEGTVLNQHRRYYAGMCVAFSLPVIGISWMIGQFGGTDLLMPVIYVGLWIAAVSFLLIPATDRAINFGVDGDWIESPIGLHYHPGTVRWRFKNSDIVSIEVWRNRMLPVDDIRHEVVFLMNDGDIIHVAANLHEHHATKVARQLTHALSEVRAARGVNTYYAQAGE